jgi:hypothetical protein
MNDLDTNDLALITGGNEPYTSWCWGISVPLGDHILCLGTYYRS